MSWPIYLIADTPKTGLLNLYVNILNRPTQFNFAHPAKRINFIVDLREN
jgi:hypothetical protein